MALMVLLSCVLLAAGVLAVRWRNMDLALPDTSRPGTAAPSLIPQLRLYLWFLTLATLSGLAVGVIVVGAGGRLAMRLLAATSPEARGKLTEANEVVGRISVDGTLGFIVFGALPAGLLAAVCYVVLSRALPRGLLGGLVLGAVLLIAVGAVIDPLRSDNVDFAIVGPGWLAVTVYASLALVTGVSAAAFTARLSHALPLPRRSALGYAPLVTVLTLALSGSVLTTVLMLGVGAILFHLGHKLLRSASNSSRVLTLIVRGAVVVITLTALPKFVGAVADIVS